MYGHDKRCEEALTEIYAIFGKKGAIAQQAVRERPGGIFKNHTVFKGIEQACVVYKNHNEAEWFSHQEDINKESRQYNKELRDRPLVFLEDEDRPYKKTYQIKCMSEVESGEATHSTGSEGIPKNRNGSTQHDDGSGGIPKNQNKPTQHDDEGGTKR
mmetsp:Transcript_42920/g.55137  ORF Transcript_42920/g.55137 Transcript_42920/m.55137 type:complete len:157 (-) Transcript_42920:141-611(-)